MKKFGLMLLLCLLAPAPAFALCLEQRGAAAGCIAPSGTVYGNSNVGWFDTETTANQAVATFFIANTSCQDCYGMGVKYNDFELV